MIPDLMLDSDSLLISVSYQVCSGSGPTSLAYNLVYGNSPSQSGETTVFLSDMRKSLVCFFWIWYPSPYIHLQPPSSFWNRLKCSDYYLTQNYFSILQKIMF